MRKINEIIIHCTGTTSFASVQSICDYTRKKFGIVSYHFLIDRTGKIHCVLPISEKGAHCFGHNSHSIGIAYIGGCIVDRFGKLVPKDTRTPAQIDSMHSLLRTLVQAHPISAIRGHREFANKACPCYDVSHEHPLYMYLDLI